MSLDKPLNNDVDLNILRPAVLRQYFGTDVEEQGDKVKRHTYGSGSGSSSVGMDPLNFVTRPWNARILAMSNEIQDILHDNKNMFNLNTCNMDARFNHCTILIYYSGQGLKEKSSLGYHTDCIYSPATGKYVYNQNSQVENTPAVIYSVGDSRNLHWKVRKVGISTSGRKIWMDSKCSKMVFKLGSDTMTVINPMDENPCSPDSEHDMRQYLHGGVKVSGEKFSVGFVFRVVNRIELYHKVDDTLVVENENSDIVNGLLGFDLGKFHTNLIRVYCNALNSINI